MINTKLIIFDGITGSGKSTTSHFIARQLEKNGIKVKWIYEDEKDHPLHYRSDAEDDVFDINDFVVKFIDLWKKFVDMIQHDDTVYVIESFLFQDFLTPCIEYDCENQLINSFYQQIKSIVSALNPAIIHFYQDDVEKALFTSWQRRGDEWEKWRISVWLDTPYCINRNYKDKYGVVKMWQEVSDTGLKYFNELDLIKIKIETSAHNYENYRTEIMRFLGIPIIDEIIFQDDYLKYCGDFSGKKEWFKIHIENNRLCADVGWPNLKLIEINEGEFEIEGFPLAFKFISDDKGNIKSLQITKALCEYAEGDILTKFYPNELDIDLNYFCGEYYKEINKSIRKIYIKTGCLYYWVSEDTEYKLFPVSKSQLAWYNGNGMLTFEESDNVKKFILSSQDDEDRIFVQND